MKRGVTGIYWLLNSFIGSKTQSDLLFLASEQCGTLPTIQHLNDKSSYQIIDCWVSISQDSSSTVISFVLQLFLFVDYKILAEDLVYNRKFLLSLSILLTNILTSPSLLDRQMALTRWMLRVALAWTEECTLSLALVQVPPFSLFEIPSTCLLSYFFAH